MPTSIRTPGAGKAYAKAAGRMLCHAAAVASVALVSSCTGTVGTSSSSSSKGNNAVGSSTSPGGGSGSGGGTAATSGSGGGSSTGATGTASSGPPTDSPPLASLHLLTNAQFVNSVQDLLGAGAPLAPVQPDYEVDGFAQVGGSALVVSPSGVGLYETATGTATAWAFADATHAGAVLSCVPQAITDACTATALTAFGRRAWRRPLTTDETSRFVTLATTIATQPGGTVLMGLQHAVWAMLQSPSFLYRVELGVASVPDGGRLKYTSFEMASRLASTLWNSVPDDMLLDAATADQITTPAQITTQAQRMLSDARAHRGLVAFVDDLYAMTGDHSPLTNLQEATKDSTMFPKWSTTIQSEMQQELEQRVDDIVLTEPGDFLSLYDSATTFVNDDLATYYGLPTSGTAGFHKVQLPAGGPRLGLLGSGAILAENALPQRTSPTLRGLFVDQAILCKTIPPPPPGVPPLPAMAGPNTTLRQQLTAHRAAAQCAACHTNMDPIGFGMENFDTSGIYRTTDNGQPIDASGTIDGASFDSLAQLGTALRNDPLSGPCFVSKVYTNSQGRAATDWDNVPLSALSKQFATSGHRADQLLLNLVISDAFRFVQPSQQL